MELNPGRICDIRFSCKADADAISTCDWSLGPEKFGGFILRMAHLHTFAHILLREFLILGIKDQNVQIFVLPSASHCPPTATGSLEDLLAQALQNRISHRSGLTGVRV